MDTSWFKSTAALMFKLSG